MHRHPAFWRYTAFQIPGWIIIAYGVWWAHRSLAVPVWVAASVLGAWVIKDYALFPLLRSAYERDDRLQIERIIGERGRATDRLGPTGYIQVRGELWRARTTQEDSAINRGDHVEVTGVDGTTLLVTSAVGSRQSESKNTRPTTG